MFARHARSRLTVGAGFVLWLARKRIFRKNEKNLARVGKSVRLRPSSNQTQYMKVQIGVSYYFQGDIVTVTEINGANCIVESENGEEEVKCSRLKELNPMETHGHHDGPMFGY